MRQLTTNYRISQSSNYAAINTATTAATKGLDHLTHRNYPPEY